MRPGRPDSQGGFLHLAHRQTAVAWSLCRGLVIGEKVYYSTGKVLKVLKT